MNGTARVANVKGLKFPPSSEFLNRPRLKYQGFNRDQKTCVFNKVFCELRWLSRQGKRAGTLERR